MSFLFVDKIASCGEHEITGTKIITGDEPYLVTSKDKESVFIPSLMGEAIGQLAAWKAMQALDFECRPVAGIVDEVEILGDASIGDELQLFATIETLDKQKVQYNGRAEVNGKTTFTIRHALGPMVPMQDFIETAVVKEQYQQALAGKKKNLLMSERTRIDGKSIGFDDSSVFEDKGLVIARKTLIGDELYLRDHFPMKPVLPLTILLNAKMQLAQAYLQAYTDFSPSKTTVRKIKMTRFVEPGESIQTEMSLKLLDNNQARFAFTTKKQGKRICVCEAIFE